MTSPPENWAGISGEAARRVLHPKARPCGEIVSARVGTTVAAAKVPVGLTKSGAGTDTDGRVDGQRRMLPSSVIDLQASAMTSVDAPMFACSDEDVPR